MEAPRRRGNPTERRRRQVRWAKRLRRLGLAWQNALEIARAGRLAAPYGAPFEVVHEEPVYRLRRYPRTPGEPGTRPIAAPLVLVPPLMVTAEVYDISPDVSAVAFLQRAGVDVWLLDFGVPEREEGGMDRTLDDYVRAVSDATDRVRAIAGHDVHLAGYSQGGMFCYQAAAFRRSAGIASIITFGSPVDLHRTLRVGEDTTERLISGLRAALAWPLSRIEGLPGFFTSTGFKLLSARKEVKQLIEFVKNLHDREALEKREAKRLFLGGEGFVAWPGPAFRKFVDELVVGNRMASGGFVIDGHTVTLADIASPILYFLGSRDEMGRPAAVRGIRRACPKVDVMYEVPLKAGHFGLVVGSNALEVTWPSVVDWLRWREGSGAPPVHAIDARAADAPATTRANDASDDERSHGRASAVAGAIARAGAHVDDVVSVSGHAGVRTTAAAADVAGIDADADDEEDDDDERDGFDFELARELVDKTAKIIAQRVSELSEDLGNYLDNARWQLPRLARLRHLQDDSRISLGKALADQAREIGDRTFFLFRGRAFSYADANRRVDAVVRGLLASGIRAGDRVGVMMKSRPRAGSVVAALSRIGAVAVLLSPATPDDVLARALELGEAGLLVVDPDGAARARATLTGPIFVLGGAGEVPWQPGERRVVPAGVVDLEAIDPAAVALPPWYRPDPGRARELAMVFVSSGKHEPPRAVRITNRRWAFSALGAAAAATLTTRDTVYCCLPLHHPSGTLVAIGSALISGARLALASRRPSSPVAQSASPAASAAPLIARAASGTAVGASGTAVGASGTAVGASGTALGTSGTAVGASGTASGAARRGPADSSAAAGVRDPFDLPESFSADTFWDEVRRYGVTVVYYAGEMCRRLVDAPPVLGEANNPVRLFAGSGMRRGVWRRVVERFGPVGVLEMYASTEASMVLANARGKKLGSVGRPLPGSPDVAIAAWSLEDDDFVRDGAGRLVHARLDEPGMLIARLTETAELAHIDPRRLLRDAFTSGDLWFVTGDFFQVDTEGDYWFVDRQRDMIATRHGPVASTRIEDALYDAPGIALCAATGRPDPDDHAHRFPIAAIQLHAGATLDLDALSRTVATLPEYARPRRVRIVDSLAVTDGFRPIKRVLDQLDLADGPDVLAWDPRAQHYRATAPHAEPPPARPPSWTSAPP